MKLPGYLRIANYYVREFAWRTLGIPFIVGGFAAGWYAKQPAEVHRSTAPPADNLAVMLLVVDGRQPMAQPGAFSSPDITHAVLSPHLNSRPVRGAYCFDTGTWEFSVRSH